MLNMLGCHGSHWNILVGSRVDRCMISTGKETTLCERSTRPACKPAGFAPLEARQRVPCSETP